MGVLDALTRLLGSPTAGKYRTSYNNVPVDVFAHMSPGSGIDGFSIEKLWATQPHLRTVVDFIARNIAQLGLHAFVSDGDEICRQRGTELAKLLKRPNGYQTGYELIDALVGDLALYDEAYLAVDYDGDRYNVHHLPSGWVTPVTVQAFAPPVFEVIGVEGVAARFNADEIVAFKGWTPGNPLRGTSPVETLRLILEEQWSSRQHRKQVWSRNGRVGSYITRPQDAPQWTGADRARFYEMLAAFTGNDGPRAGGMPLFEDGMSMSRVGFSSKDEEWSESEKLSLATCAQVFHINPTMIGLLDNANYSNVREFRRSLYGDSLGPVIKQVEDRLNAFLLPMIGADETESVEFNVEAKLRGSFEEQAGVISTSVGGPWMTRNEARRLQNLPAIEGGDELITPLNVTAGGQASPRDGGEGRPAGAIGSD